MSITTTHYPNAIVLPGSPAKKIVQLEDVVPNANYQDLVLRASGEVFPSYTGALTASPDFTFGTTQLKTILDELSANGLVKDYGGGNLDIEYREGKNAGLREAIATTTNIRGRCPNAMLAFLSLSADQGAPARMRCRLAMRSTDGITGPITWTDGVAISAEDPVQHIYTLGPLKINGSLIGGGQSVEWNNQLSINDVAGDGEIFPSYTEVAGSEAQVIFRARNAGLMTTFQSPVPISSLTMFLRKGANDGMLVANSTQEHIALTAAAGVVKARTASGDATSVELICHLRHVDGVLFTVDTTAEIS